MTTGLGYPFVGFDVLPHEIQKDSVFGFGFFMV